MGSIIMTAAVLDTHMDKKPVAAIKPNTMLLMLVPSKEIIDSAMRLCRSHFSIAKAIIKPPRNRKIIGLPYAAVTALLSSTPVIGSRIMGSSDVTGIGMASVIHHTATHKVVASTMRPSKLKPAGWKNITTKANSKGPSTKPIFCAVLYTGGRGEWPPLPWVLWESLRDEEPPALEVGNAHIRRFLTWSWECQS